MVRGAVGVRTTHVPRRKVPRRRSDDWGHGEFVGRVEPHRNIVGSSESSSHILGKK